MQWGIALSCASKASLLVGLDILFIGPPHVFRVCALSSPLVNKLFTLYQSKCGWFNWRCLFYRGGKTSLLWILYSSALIFLWTSYTQLNRVRRTTVILQIEHSIYLLPLVLSEMFACSILLKMIHSVTDMLYWPVSIMKGSPTGPPTIPLTGMQRTSVQTETLLVRKITKITSLW